MAEWPELARYSEKAPRPYERLYKGSLGWPPLAQKRRKLMETKEEKNLAKESNSAEFIRHLSSLEKVFGERGEAIAGLQGKIASLEGKVAERNIGGGITVVSDDKSDPDVNEKVSVTEIPATESSIAWQGSKSDWQTVEKRDIVMDSTETAETTPLNKEIGEEYFQRSTAGQIPKQSGLKLIYLKKVPRQSYSQLTVFFTKLGIRSHWIRHYAMMASDTLELLVFEEKAEEIIRIVREKAPRYEVLMNHDPLQGTRKYLRSTETRIKRHIKKLPVLMYMTKKVLNCQLETVQARLKDLLVAEREASSRAKDVIAERTVLGPFYGVRQQMSDCLRVACWNARGIAKKYDDLLQCMTKFELDFVFVSETHGKGRSCPTNDAVICWNPLESDESEGFRQNHHGTALLAGKHINKRDVQVVKGANGKSIWWRYAGIVFGGIYLPPKIRGAEEYNKALLEPPEAMRGPEKRVLLGDFNMRLGKITGDKIFCYRAKALLPWLTENGYVICNDDSGIPTFETRQGERTVSSIPDQVWSTLGTAMHLITKVVSEADLGGSDHRLLFTELLLDGKVGDNGSAEPSGRLEQPLFHVNQSNDMEAQE